MNAYGACQQLPRRYLAPKANSDAFFDSTRRVASTAAMVDISNEDSYDSRWFWLINYYVKSMVSQGD